MHHRSAFVGLGITFAAACSLAACGSSGGKGNGSPGSSSSGSSGSGSGSGSSGSTSSSGSASGSGSGSGGSSGSGSSGSSGSGSSGTSGSGSGSSSGSSSGGNGDTQLAGGLSGLSSLLVVGSNAYWVAPKTGIQSVAVTGGTPTTIYADASIDGTLATDGTLLYFTSSPNGASELDSVSLTGSGEQMLASGFEILVGKQSGSQMFVTGGNVYFATFPTSIVSVPTAGGTATTVATSTQQATLLWADASGLYFLDGLNVDWTPLAGGTPATVYDGSGATAGNTPVAIGSLTVVGGTAYLLVDSDGTGSGSVALMKSTGGATATTVATYGNEATQSGSGIVGDANGLYEFVGGNSGGIYGAAPSTGAQTLLDSPIDLTNDVHALDASHVYFGQVGNSQFSLWARAR